MHKYTPGPWLPDEFGLDIPNACNCLRSDAGTAREWTAVSVIIPDDDGDGYDYEHVAYCHPDNAPLIAAAPDMLAALTNAIAWVEMTGIADSDPAEYIAMKGAIAKAEGREG